MSALVSLACISESQRTDRHYYAIARAGHDCTTGETDQGALQRYAAKRSRRTRQALFAALDASRPAAPGLQHEEVDGDG